MFGLDLGWVVATVLGGIAVGKWLKKKDDTVEERRTLALDVADGLRVQGLEVIPDVLKAYAVGNYSEVLKKLREGAMVMTNPQLSTVVFGNLFEKMLAAKAGNPESRAELVARLTGSEPVIAKLQEKTGVATLAK